MTGLEAYLRRTREAVDAALERWLPAATSYPPQLHEAMRYSVFAGGKRLRPILTLLSCETCGGDDQRAMCAAGALELVHTYSLIHDDLPAMDDDDFRRGRPSCHKAFGEAAAILAGDALLTYAFELLATHCEDQDLIPCLTRELAVSAGVGGMIGGQMVDIQAEGQEADQHTLEYIHDHKTGALITAAVRMGALVARARPEQLDSLTTYGRRIGLAYQIADDILDIESTTAKLGKTAGKDAEEKKLTYPLVFGLAESRRRSAALVEEARAALSEFGEKAAMLL